VSRKRHGKRRRLVAETAYYKVWSDGVVKLDVKGASISIKPFLHEVAALVAVARYTEDLTDDEAKALWEVQEWVGSGEALPDPGIVEVMRQGMTRLVLRYGQPFVEAWHTAIVGGLGSFNVMIVTAPGELLELLRDGQGGAIKRADR